MNLKRIALFMALAGLLSPAVVRPAQENRSASTPAQTQVTPAPKTDDANAGAADPNEKLKKQKEKGPTTSERETSNRAEEKKKVHSNSGKKETPARVATPSSKS